MIDADLPAVTPWQLYRGSQQVKSEEGREALLGYAADLATIQSLPTVEPDRRLPAWLAPAESAKPLPF